MKIAKPEIPTTTVFTVGDTVVRFEAADGKSTPQLSLLPKGLAPAKHREFLPDDVEICGLPAKWQPVRAYSLDSLVHLKLREEDAPSRDGSLGRDSVNIRSCMLSAQNPFSTRDPLYLLSLDWHF